MCRDDVGIIFPSALLTILVRYRSKCRGLGGRMQLPGWCLAHEDPNPTGGFSRYRWGIIYIVGLYVNCSIWVKGFSVQANAESNAAFIPLPRQSVAVFGLQNGWVAVKELKLSHHKKETLLFTVYAYILILW